MSTKYKFKDSEACYFVTYAVVDWADVFTRNVYREILLDSWKYCQQHKGLNIHAYVIMTNHAHMIMSKSGETALESIMRDMKKFTSVKLLEAIQSNNKESRREWLLELFRKAGKENSNNTINQFWQQDNHPIQCSTPEILKQKMNYVHENPVRAGLVEKPEDWHWSSAVDYYLGKKGLIDLSFV